MKVIVIQIRREFQVKRELFNPFGQGKAEKRGLRLCVTWDVLIRMERSGVLGLCGSTG